MLPEALVAAAVLSLAAATAPPPGEGSGDVPVARSRNRNATLKLPSDLRAADADDDAALPYLVDLREQLDFQRAAKVLAGKSSSRKSRRAWVRGALASIAARSQRRLRSLLEDLRRRGDIASWTGVSIVNRLVVMGNPRGIRALARSAEVDSIAPEVESQAALEEGLEKAAVADAPGWPLDALGAREAWKLGFDGTGVTVGLIDSGASSLHEQLRDNFRGGRASWFDPLRGDAEPWDVQTGHGTAVLSCAVGHGAGGDSAGVAPGARWIAAVGLNGGRYNNVLVTRAADWMLNVGDPDVLVLAFRAPGTGCDDSLRGIVNALRAAEMLVVFAAGNGGPDPRTDVSPANYGRLFPGSGSALSVGAVDSQREVDPHSSRGPGRCGASLFPQVVAPGAEVRVAVPAGPSLYRRATGTSFAAGFVAGAAALLLQALPHARVDRIEEALRRGAIDLGPRGPDSTYGYGLVNIPGALQSLKSEPRPPP